MIKEYFIGYSELMVCCSPTEFKDAFSVGMQGGPHLNGQCWSWNQNEQWALPIYAVKIGHEPYAETNLFPLLGFLMP